jgi:hypothetical protein
MRVLRRIRTRGQGLIEPGEMLGTESRAGHRVGVGDARGRREDGNDETPTRYPEWTFRVPVCRPSEVPPPFRLLLLQSRLDDLRERTACAIQTRLHGAEVAVRDLGDLLVGAAFELPEDEHFPVMLR